jgi:hypothetical protein
MHVTDPAEEPNVVEVVGGAQLAGNLQITLADGYSPQIGDRFGIMNAGQVTGTFDSATIPNPGGGNQFHPIYTATDVMVLVAGAGDKTWGVDSNGRASLAANWLGGVAPGAIDDKVAFTTIITGDRAVAVDVPFTAGSLYFDDNNNYLVQGSEKLTLNVSSGIARIDVKNLHGSGAHTISAPLVLNDNTTIDVASGTSLSITSQITAARGVVATKDGPGALSVRNVRADGLTINAGTVRVLPGGGGDGTSVLKSLSITGTARLDLSNNALVLDYDGIASPIADVRAKIASGFAGGSWTGNGITSSDAAGNPARAIGYAEAADVLGASGGTFVGHPVDGTAVLVRFTIKGDANLDGTVSFTDLVALAQNYNKSGMPWNKGDFNYDTNVDFTDLVALAQNYNSALPTSPIAGASAAFDQDLAAAMAQVPEPSILASLWITSLSVLSRRRRTSSTHWCFSQEWWR